MRAAQPPSRLSHTSAGTGCHTSRTAGKASTKPVGCANAISLQIAAIANVGRVCAPHAVPLAGQRSRPIPLPEPGSPRALSDRPRVRLLDVVGAPNRPHIPTFGAQVGFRSRFAADSVAPTFHPTWACPCGARSRHHPGDRVVVATGWKCDRDLGRARASAGDSGLRPSGCFRPDLTPPTRSRDRALRSRAGCRRDR